MTAHRGAWLAHAYDHSSLTDDGYIERLHEVREID